MRADRMPVHLGRTAWLLLVAVLALLGMPGCQMAKKLPAEHPHPIPAQSGPAQDPLRPAEPGLLRDHHTRLQLQLVEQTTKAEELEAELEALQRRLDAAIQEVVRTKAKLRSLESRAEAASTIAEAEIALKSLDRPDTGSAHPDLGQTEQLLRMSTREFESENFGGALYLAEQVKAQVQAARSKLQARELLTPPSSDEVAFELPLALKVTTRSNIRKGPGLDFDVLAVLDTGTEVTGYSSRGKWLRVKTRQGLAGWMHQALVAGRR